MKNLYSSSFRRALLIAWCTAICHPSTLYSDQTGILGQFNVPSINTTGLGEPAATGPSQTSRRAEGIHETQNPITRPVSCIRKWGALPFTISQDFLCSWDTEKPIWKGISLSTLNQCSQTQVGQRCRMEENCSKLAWQIHGVQGTEGKATDGELEWDLWVHLGVRTALKCPGPTC